MTLPDRCKSPTTPLSLILSEVTNKLNELQKTIAAYISTAITDCNRQIWELGPGIGKSRIAAATGFMLLSSEVYKSVHFVIPNAGLKKRDMDDFDDYWELSKYASKVTYHDSIDFKPRQNSVVLIDEADVLIFKDPRKFRDFVTKSPTVCFTATPPNDSVGRLENVIYGQMGMRQFSFWPSRLDKVDRVHIPEALHKMDDTELANFIVGRAEV